MTGETRHNFNQLVSPLLLWLAFTGLIVYGLYLVWDFGFLARLTAGDPSRISWAILVLFAGSNLYLGWVAFGLHRDWQNLLRSLNTAQNADKSSLLLLQIRQFQQQPSSAKNKSSDGLNTAIQKLISGRLESGWFIADLLFKLGLIGTVVGFIFMLTAVTDIKSMDITMARQMLSDMSGGMRLALYTTLAGLSTGAIIGFQVHVLERWCQQLESRLYYHLNASVRNT